MTPLYGHHRRGAPSMSARSNKPLNAVETYSRCWDKKALTLALALANLACFDALAKDCEAVGDPKFGDNL